MKINYKLNRKPARCSPATVCRRACGQLLKQIRQVKISLQHEFSEALAGHEPLLNLALNEAEALAWQTPYPHLFFPTLAQEKAQAVRRWAYRQRSIRQAGPNLAFAA